jgi:putative copper export protein
VTLDPEVITAIKSTTRAAVYGASALVVGAAIFQTMILPRASGMSADERAHARAGARTIGYFAAWVLLLAHLARLYIQVIDSFLVAIPTTEMIGQLFFSTRTWGLGILAQTIISAILVLLLMATRRARGDVPWLAMGSALLAAVSVPLTGHAIGHAGPVAVAAQATHVFAGGSWLGALTVLWLTCRRLPSAASLVAVIRAFSPVALASAALLALAGTATYFLHVGDLSHLLTTEYGVVLVLKIAVFMSAAGAGYANWRHVVPRLAASGQRVTFTRSAALEIALAVVALLLTTVLTNLPQPGDE